MSSRIHSISITHQSKLNINTHIHTRCYMELNAKEKHKAREILGEAREELTEKGLLFEQRLEGGEGGAM